MKIKNFCSVLFLCIGISLQTPLDDYVNTPDEHYKYEVIETVQFSDYKLVYINMTSQKWQDGKRFLKKYMYLLIFTNFFQKQLSIDQFGGIG